MPPASVVQNANPAHLSNNTFLVNLAVTFHVTSIPLAIFILIVVLIGCVLFLVVCIMIARSCLRRKFIAKRRKRGLKSIYLDEIPGALEQKDDSNFGRIEYSLEYNMDDELLTVGVIQASQLKSVAPRAEMMDPYAYITVITVDNGQTRVIDQPMRTNVCKQTRDPKWSKTFTYKLREQQLGNASIKFEVFDYDSLGQDSSVGQIIVQLKDIDQGEYAGKIFEKIAYLEQGRELVDGIGRVCIGLAHYPTTKHMDVTIYECQDISLPIKPENVKNKKKSTYSISCELKRKNTNIGSNETKPKTELKNPYYNEKMSFPVKNELMEEYGIILHLKLNERLRRKRTVGQVEIGYGTLISTGVKHWEEMLKGPSKVHVMWHSIIPH